MQRLFITLGLIRPDFTERDVRLGFWNWTNSQYELPVLSCHQSQPTNEELADEFVRLSGLEKSDIIIGAMDLANRELLARLPGNDETRAVCLRITGIYLYRKRARTQLADEGTGRWLTRLESTQGQTDHGHLICPVASWALSETGV